MTVTWRFVDTPVTTPAILLDMNDKINFALDMGQSFDVSPPALVKSVTGNNLSDGGRLTSAIYNNRFLKFSLALDPMGSMTVFQKEQLLTELNMELAKPSNLIMYKSAPASEPVFFRTLRSDTYSFVSRGGSRKSWRVDCEVEAQPYAIGIRQSPIVNVQVSNDPAAGVTNKTILDITGIKGDAPAPAFIRIGSGFGAASGFVISQKTASGATSLLPFVQGESATFGTDTSTFVNASGSGGNTGRTTFTTNATLIDRLTFNIPFTIAGTYRVFARVISLGIGTYQFRMKYPGSTAFFGPTIEWVPTAGAQAQVLDLGVMDFPFPGQRPIMHGYSQLAPTGFPTQQATVQLGRTTGTFAMDVDFIYFMPADERLCTLKQNGTPNQIIIDGPNELAYGMASGSDPFSGTRVVDNGGSLVTLFSGSPVLVPAVTNRWFFQRTQNVTISSTFQIWVDYWPQWRVVAIP